MEGRRALAYVLLDLVLVAVAVSAVRFTWRLIVGDGFDPLAALSTLFFAAVYTIGALRLGASPLRYLSDLGRPVYGRAESQDEIPSKR